VPGPEAAAAAAAASQVLFGEPLDGVDAATLATVASEVPTYTVTRRDLDGGLDLVDLLVSAGLAPSKGQARKLVDGRGVAVNNVRAEAGRVVGEGDLLHDRYVLLRKGRDYALVTVG
jgi:tyrosyl-tRNA synthetase